MLQEQEYRHCYKKMARLLFHFRVIGQVLSSQRTMSVIITLRRSHSVDNSWGVTTVALC